MAKKKTSKGSGKPVSISDATGKQLVIVESPAKARTINNYLGSEYVVAACVGHVRDLPDKNPKGSRNPVPGVDLDHDFKPTYQIIKGKDIIRYHYVLEVSSPGLNRPLKKQRDFERSIGKMIRLTMSRPVNNQKSYTGRLANVNEGMIRLLVDNDRFVNLPLKEVDKARLKYEFNTN